MNELITELSKPEYVNLNHQEAADAINAKTVEVNTLVPNTLIKQHAMLSKYWPLIKAGQLDSDPVKAGLCVNVVDWLTDSQIQNTDVYNPGVVEMIGGLISFNLITETQANEIKAMGKKLVSWTSTVGLPELGIGLIINTRKEMGVK